jgi:hypothetical protein
VRFSKNLRSIDGVKAVLLPAKITTHFNFRPFGQNAFNLPSAQGFDHAAHTLCTATAGKVRTTQALLRLIGIQAVVLNGAKIGKNSIVGAGSVVTEGKEFPDNSLIIGSPAKVVRILDDAAPAKLRQSAEHYAQNSQRFAKGLKRIS